MTLILATRDKFTKMPYYIPWSAEVVDTCDVVSWWSEKSDMGNILA